jgi:hypothetical protein
MAQNTFLKCIIYIGNKNNFEIKNVNVKYEGD